MSLDAIEAAREHATSTMIGHDGIVGVGRTADSVVLFVDDRRRTDLLLRAWRRRHSVPVEIKEVGCFLAAHDGAPLRAT